MSQIDIELFNEGTETISNVIVRIALPETSKIINVAIEPPLEKADVQVHESKAVVTLPYVNAYKDHNEILVLSILADGKAEPISVRGSGDGWSIRHIRLPTERQVHFGVPLVFIGLFLLYGLLYAYMLFAESTFGIPRGEFSPRALVASLPMLVAFVIFMVPVKRWLKRALRARGPRPTKQIRTQKSDA